LYLLKRFLKTFYLTGRKIFFSFLSKMFLPRKKKNLHLRFDKLLIIAPPRIGDAALALPVFAALRNAFPKSQLNVAANKYVAEILSLAKEIDKIIPIAENLRTKIYYLCGIIKNPEYDLAMDLNFDYHLYPAMIAGLSAKFSVGYEYAGRGFLLSEGLSIIESNMHASDIFFQPILDILPSAEKMKPHLDVPHEIISKTQVMLTNVGIGEEDKLILIHPGAYHPTQRWLPEYFAETAQRIMDFKRAKVVFAGGPGEEKLINDIQMTMLKPAHATFTDIGIKNLIGLISRSDLMICNNSGPLHIAVAVNTPTISFMGPTIKERWMPIGEIHKDLRIDDLPCIGCNLGYCKIKTHDCMRLIKPSIVFEAIKDHFRAI
jgi:ADP-heptose:LPS heptosyltransferase